MPYLPVALPIGFVAITFITVYLFYRAIGNYKVVLFVSIAWLVLQGVAALKGFYLRVHAFPPPFLLAVAPAALAAVVLAVGSSRGFINGISLPALTLLHSIRIAVEVVLLYLFYYKAIPPIMTFEGRNWDILSGLTAPVLYYLVFVKRKLSVRWLLWWHVACLLLLLNIVVIALLSAPFGFQQFGFEQPNVAVLHFPFIWLPCCVVPLVLCSHLLCIRKLVQQPL